MNDILVKFKSLIGINVQDEANFKWENNNVRNLLLKVKYKNAPLFTGVEQGTGEKQDHIHILFTSKLKCKAQQ